jgi:hypothetical protein
MSTAIAYSINQAKELLQSGSYRKIKLDFDIGADEFFSFAGEHCSDCMKVKHVDGAFILEKV